MTTSIYLNPATKFQASYGYNKYTLGADLVIAAAGSPNLTFTNGGANVINITGVASIVSGNIQILSSGTYWIAPSVAFSVADGSIPDIQYEMIVTRAGGGDDNLVVYASRLGAAVVGTEYVIPSGYAGYFGPGDTIKIKVSNRATAGDLTVLNNRTSLVLTKLY